MQAASVKERLSALGQRGSRDTLPLWAPALPPSESLRVLGGVDAPWATLLRADAYLRRDLPAQAQRELEPLSSELPSGLARMREALEKKIALRLAGCASGDKNESAAPDHAPLQQWLSRVREFRKRR